MLDRVIITVIIITDAGQCDYYEVIIIRLLFETSDFIWPFLRLYIGVILNSKMAFIFPISCILALIFPILIKYFPNV